MRLIDDVFEDLGLLVQVSLDVIRLSLSDLCDGCLFRLQVLHFFFAEAELLGELENFVLDFI